MGFPGFAGEGAGFVEIFPGLGFEGLGVQGQRFKSLRLKGSRV